MLPSALALVFAFVFLVSSSLSFAQNADPHNPLRQRALSLHHPYRTHYAHVSAVQYKRNQGNVEYRSTSLQSQRSQTHAHDASLDFHASVNQHSVTSTSLPHRLNGAHYISLSQSSTHSATNHLEFSQNTLSNSDVQSRNSYQTHPRLLNPSGTYLPKPALPRPASTIYKPYGSTHLPSSEALLQDSHPRYPKTTAANPNFHILPSSIDTSQTSYPFTDPAASFNYCKRRDLTPFVRQHFVEALKIMPPELLASANLSATDVENSIGFTRMSASYLSPLFWYHRSPAYRFTYARIYKSGNDLIRFNLEKAFPEKRIANIVGLSMANDCLFTFIRDPVRRWISGYNEIEWRWNGLPQYRHSLNFLERRNGRMMHRAAPLGTEERVHRFIVDLVQGRFLGDAESHHIYPQYTFARFLPRLDFIGRVEQIQKGWTDFQKRCTPQREPTPLNMSLGDHESKRDVFGTKKAAMRLTADENFVRILCHLTIVDYLCFNFELPPECKGMLDGATDMLNQGLAARAAGHANAYQPFYGQGVGMAAAGGRAQGQVQGVIHRQ